MSRCLRVTVRRRFSRMQNQRRHIPMVDFGLPVVSGAARRGAESMMQARPPEVHKELFKLSPNRGQVLSSVLGEAFWLTSIGIVLASVLLCG